MNALLVLDNRLMGISALAEKYAREDMEVLGIGYDFDLGSSGEGYPPRMLTTTRVAPEVRGARVRENRAEPSTLSAGVESALGQRGESLKADEWRDADVRALPSMGSSGHYFSPSLPAEDTSSCAQFNLIRSEANAGQPGEVALNDAFLGSSPTVSFKIMSIALAAAYRALQRK